jgi:hypothetical protein
MTSTGISMTNAPETKVVSDVIVPLGWSNFVLYPTNIHYSAEVVTITGKQMIVIINEV